MRKINRLSSRACENAKPRKGKFVERLCDGDGLYLQVTKSKDGFNRGWIFRFKMDGRSHDYGIGPLHRVSLAEARLRRTDLRLAILDGTNPLTERKQAKTARLAAKAQELKAQTFEQCTEAYYKVLAPSLKNDKYRAQWLRGMVEYAYPTLGKLSVADIETAHIGQALAPIWSTKSDTAGKIQAQIKRVFDYAKANKYRTGDNPAERELLVAMLGKLTKSKTNHKALPYADVPTFVAKLRQTQSTAALALEFCILNCNRTEEVVGAKWSEFDLDKRLWVIPGERMKKGKEHRVPLTDRALEILRGLKRSGDTVFGIGSDSMFNLLRRSRIDATVHGFRSSFRDWAAERTNYPEFVVEMALAHAINDETIRAYKRTDVLEKRARLAKQWADFLARPAAETGKVVPMKRRAS